MGDMTAKDKIEIIFEYQVSCLYDKINSNPNGLAIEDLKKLDLLINIDKSLNQAFTKEKPATSGDQPVNAEQLMDLLKAAKKTT